MEASVGSSASRSVRSTWSGSLFPHGTSPQVAIDAPLPYGYYAKCVELGIPMFVTIGIARPRVASLVQHVERLDQVLCDFPDLLNVMRHGELLPDFDRRLRQLARRRQGAPCRIFPDGPHPGENLHRAGRRPFNDDVWPGLLGGNAARVLILNGAL
jgi:hypothetical protein